MPDLDKGGSAQEYVNAEFGPSLGWVKTPFDAQMALQAFNVKDFGAKGDGDLNGIGTDDTSAIQTAENALAGNGGVLFFPPGIYVVKGDTSAPAPIHNGAIIKRDKVRWIGVPGASILIAKNGTDTRVVVHPDQTTHFAACDIYGMIFDGNVANAPSVHVSSVFEVWPLDSGHFSDVVFRNGSGYGCSFQGFTAPYISNDCLFERCVFSGNGSGNAGDVFDGFDAKKISNFTFVECISHDNHEHGFDCRGLNIAFINCEAYNMIADLGVGGDGIALQVLQVSDGGGPYATNASIIGGSFHDNAGQGIRLLAGTEATDDPCRVVVVGADVYNNGSQGLFLTDNGVGSTGNFILESCNVHDNTLNGVSIEGAQKAVQIIGGRYENNGDSGIRVGTNAGNVRIVGAVSTNNAVYGLKENTPTVTTVNAIGCDFSGNAAGNTGPSDNQGSGSVLISSGSGTVSNLDFKLAPYLSKYRELKIILTNVQPSVNNATLRLRTSTNNGSTYDSGAGNYAWSWNLIYPDATTSYLGHNASDTSISTGLQISNDPNSSARAEITIPNLTNGGIVYQIIEIDGLAVDGVPLVGRVTASGQRTAAVAVNAVRFFMDSGAMGVTWAFYGVL